MADEEKIVSEPVVEEPAPSEERFDDDFVDDKVAQENAEKAALAEAEAAKKAEEAKAEEEAKEEIDMHYVEESEEEPAPEEGESKEKKPAPEAPKPEPAPETYDDGRFQKIEDARIALYQKIRVWSIWKVVVVLALFADIFLSWILPRQLMGESDNVPKIVIGLVCSVVGLVGYFVFLFFNKKSDRKAMREFVKLYYDVTNDYIFGDTDAKDFVGDMDSKVSKEEFAEMSVYPGVSQIGSRANMTFTYKGMDCALADLAAQKDNGRYLQTIFVGKYLRTHNSVQTSDEGIAIYFKGGDRAIPPEGLKGRHVIENSKRFVIVGDNGDKHVLNQKFRAAMKELRTDKLLVDVAIQIKSGKTYWGLGYEDTLMVLPGREKFNPKYLIEYKNQIKQILDLALLLNE
ncbi:MAG: hypothetical protein K6F32_03955 [Bacilli bacterium]|nr:hypothetical protein [Bacilli bacterium]